MTLFEEFSAGYYVGRLYVQPYDGENAVMERDQHEAANEQIYATGEGVERLDHPLVVKVDETHVPVRGAPDVPADTLALPGDTLSATRIDDPPTLKTILVAKAEQAGRLLEWFVPDVSSDPAGAP